MRDIDRGTNNSYGCIIREINQRARLFNGNFIYEDRSSNIDADRLAKFSSSLDPGRHLWLIDPHDPIRITRHVDYDQSNLALPLKKILSRIK